MELTGTLIELKLEHYLEGKHDDEGMLLDCMEIGVPLRKKSYSGKEN